MLRTTSSIVKYDGFSKPWLQFFMGQVLFSDIKPQLGLLAQGGRVMGKLKKVEIPLSAKPFKDKHLTFYLITFTIYCNAYTLVLFYLHTLLV